jgi:small conductance mechanosensitive channel
MDVTTVVNDLFITAAEFGALALLFGLLAAGIGRGVQMLQGSRWGTHLGDVQRLKLRVRRWLLLLFLCCVGGLLLFNGTLIVQGRPVWPATVALVTASLPPNFWRQLAWALVQIALLAAAAWLLSRLTVWAAPRLERQVLKIEYLSVNERQVASFFGGLRRLIQRALWLAVVALGALALGVPAFLSDSLVVALRILLIIGFGRLLVRLIGPVVNTLDALSEKYLPSQALDAFYGQLRGLIPLLSRTLEAIIYVQAVSLAVSQVGAVSGYAVYGVRLIQVIAIVFLGRVLIEVINVLIDKFFLVRGELNEDQWRQRVTFGPLIKSVVRYGVVFGGTLLVLSTLGFDIGPILIALGGVGLVIGLAAQPVTTDLISGLFILFENLYLVGDYIETGNARGVVESIDIRTTRIRDPDGQLHLIRNGQIGDIVNFSKGYVYAVVLVSIAYKTDLERAFAVIRATGQELDKAQEDVFEPTQVQGIEEFGEGRVLIRTATRVKPGRHQDMAREFRSRIMAAFDREGIPLIDYKVSVEAEVLLLPQPLAGPADHRRTLTPGN